MSNPYYDYATSLDRWGPNDEYPDDPDFECNDCGAVFNKPEGLNMKEWDRHCPQCESADIHGGGFYG